MIFFSIDNKKFTFLDVFGMKMTLVHKNGKWILFHFELNFHEFSFKLYILFFPQEFISRHRKHFHYYFLFFNTRKKIYYELL